MRPTLNVKSISERLEGTRAFVPLRTMYHNLFRPGFAKKRLARTTFYGQFVRLGDLVFDVGANYGEYSAFIDGEHTNSAVFRDFTSVRKFLASAAILAFHDCFVTPSAFLAISRILSRERPPSPFLLLSFQQRLSCCLWLNTPRTSALELWLAKRTSVIALGQHQNAYQEAHSIDSMDHAAAKAIQASLCLVTDT
jgi:hypothetical protein